MIGFTVPIQNDGRKNIKMALRIAHNFMLDMFVAIFVNMNFCMKGIKNMIKAVQIRIAFRLLSLYFLSAICHPR